MVTNHDLTINKKDSRALNLTFTDSNGSAVDITGWTLYFTAKEQPDDVADDSLAPIRKTVTSFSNPSGGIGSITLTTSDLNIKARTYYYDIKAKTDDNDVYTVIYGNLVIEDTMTNRSS